MNKIFPALILLLLSAAATAAEWQFTSGDKQTQLIELYTSQGCSSCPPAEKYVNQLLSSKKLWTDIIPVVFHVDYWDYLGWKDQFALPTNDLRQRHYAQVGGVNSVYTPAMLINGKGWQSWRLGFSPSEKTSKAGVLAVNIHDNHLAANFKSANNLYQLQLHIALLGMNLTSNITAGEREGSHTSHNFVVLKHLTADSYDKHWTIELPNNINSEAIAVWVSSPNNPTPLQAVGGFFN